MRLDVELCYIIFFFNDTATTEIYTLSLHDALPISRSSSSTTMTNLPALKSQTASGTVARLMRSEEHTSELQSHVNLVCRLLLEKKNTVVNRQTSSTSTLNHPRLLQR